MNSTCVAISVIVKHLKCPVCMEILAYPRTLPCMHSFCQQCLHEFIINKCPKGIERGFECPVCRMYFRPYVQGIPPHLWAESFPLNFCLQGIIGEIAIKPDNIETPRVDTKACQSDFCHYKERTVKVPYDHYEHKCDPCCVMINRKCFSSEYTGTNGVLKSISEMAIDTACNEKGLFTPDREIAFTYVVNQHDAYLTNFQKQRMLCCQTNLESDLKCENALLRHDCMATRYEEHEKSNEAVNNVFCTEHAFIKRIEPFQKEPFQKKSLTRLCNSSVLGNHSQNLIDSPIGTLSGVTETQKTSRPLSPSFHNGEAHPLQSARARHALVTSFGSLNDILEENEEELEPNFVGKLVKSQIDLKDEFYIRSQADQKICCVTGITFMHDGSVLLADESNCNIKLFSSDVAFLCYLDMLSEPRDVAAMEQHMAAVTCPKIKSVCLVLVQGGALSVLRTLEFDKCCYGVAYYDHALFLAMGNEVRIINADGKIENKINRTNFKRKRFSFRLRKSLFQSAKFISIKADHSNPVIYVSDQEKSCVMTLDRKGAMLSRMRFGDQGSPMSLCVSAPGRLYVCQAPNKLISATIGEHGNVTETLLELENILCVQSSAAADRMWVSRMANNFVKVFSLKKCR
ncbi:hypothetical protein DPMN_025247 [Dreissena polymorpha]|uniref:RING-type domain-containing protein n=1 Tax=Dreissena polymorpha TaxID=45954 RepID=A0A9D4LQS3_DREPO|nr:hypothetical protein DPMN_025247 [Dreissena polymorpha]